MAWMKLAVHLQIKGQSGWWVAEAAKKGGTDRENVMAVVTIYPNDTVLQPTINFKGQNFMSKCAQDKYSLSGTVGCWR